ncbi:hypothetical protein MCOR14_005764 [Pyricularia oryzae]|uniref:Uncharacterized protein n=1 Tax=Pyricularia grisea TaxID=148305 RepID=A0ABQ8NR36_PYRGI|nr:hypothetical protein MCOR33_003614 [Pyricularia grisea]KAI6516523.1 hypothetical protein MCOR10_007673 [Pyricularia oryzae]KAI6568908.1 hypothetical protein MCOR09_005659 [Pyricularia oryzae]KAI6635486.1 hypothetical protein MCOR14_005764 [Pyricularia oryzae]
MLQIMACDFGQPALLQSQVPLSSKWTMHEERAYHTGGQPTLQTPCKGAGSTSSNTNTKDKFEAVADNISFNEEQAPCNRVRKCIRLRYMSQSDTENRPWYNATLQMSTIVGAACQMDELAFVGLTCGRRKQEGDGNPTAFQSICMDPGLSFERRLVNNAGRIDLSCIEIITYLSVVLRPIIDD